MTKLVAVLLAATLATGCAHQGRGRPSHDAMPLVLITAAMVAGIALVVATQTDRTSDLCRNDPLGCQRVPDSLPPPPR